MKVIPGEAYNVTNPKASMTIREMAKLIANTIGGGAVSVVVNKPTNIERIGYPPDATVRLGADKLMALGCNPRFSLEEMYRRMVADWVAMMTGKIYNNAEEFDTHSP